MSVAKIIEISAESESGFDHAISTGLKEAASTIENIQSAWVKDQIVLLDNGRIRGYRVHLHVTFKLKS